MNKTFSEDQLTHIRNQALIYQCACPAHVAVAIDAIRALYNQQVNCLNDSETDHAVHKCIQKSAEKNHAELEECLTDILKLEGWNLETLEMPDQLKKRLFDDI